MNQKAKRKEVAQKSLFKSESAAVTAVAAVLLLGLAFTIISVVKLNYVPEWKIDAEKDYSYDAWSNMEDVKTRADIFTRLMDSDSNYPYGLSATVPFSMGGGEIPVFEPSKSNGKLTVNTEECTMSITFHTHLFNKTYRGITYYSENRQYPDQVFRYENGALILAQGNKSQMKREPLFDISEDMGNYTVTFNAINLTGETASISANSFTALRLTGCSIDPVLNSEVHTEAEGDIESFNLTICTHYTDAWATYLKDKAEDAKIEYGINYTINSTDDYVRLSFLPTNNSAYNIYVNETVLGAELGAGGGLAYTSSGGSSGDEGGDESVMELGRWYYFNTVSDSNYEDDLDDLEDYGSVVDLSIEGTGVNLDSYIPTSNLLEHNLKNNPMELTFSYSDSTEFNSTPNSATVVMIYLPTVNNPEYQDMSVAGELLPPLGGNSKNTWYLYNQTANIYIDDPSDLKLYMKVNGVTSSASIKIDYLAIRLN